MKIGVGLPATIPGVKGPEIMEWARRGDNGPFSSLGIIDRLVYPNYEPLVTLAAVAGTTRRIRLMSTILIAPLRNAGLLAKQAASLDAHAGVLRYPFEGLSSRNGIRTQSFYSFCTFWRRSC